jgi:beta-glucosidase
MPHELMPDYLHLSPKGYAIWAEAIEDKLSSIIGDARVKQ